MIHVSSIRLIWRFLLVFVVAGTYLFLIPGSSQAHFATYTYSVDGCPAEYGKQIDPITVVFTQNATHYRTLNHLEQHTGWSNDASGSSDQYFSSHDHCGVNDDQLASDCDSCTRYHIRFRKTYHGSATYGTTSVGTPHHEDWITTDPTCGFFGAHAVDKGGVNTGGFSGFDMGRSAMYNAFNPATDHDFVLSVNWGNTREFEQCDGDYAGSNGNVYWFSIPSWYH